MKYISISDLNVIRTYNQINDLPANSQRNKLLSQLAKLLEDAFNFNNRKDDICDEIMLSVQMCEELSQYLNINNIRLDSVLSNKEMLSGTLVEK